MTPRHDTDTNLRESLGDRAEDARQKALDAYEQARDNLGQASRKARDSVSESPLIALAGGIAAGALLAALLPRTERETELVRPTAKKVRDSARAATDAARTTGTSKLRDLGITREKGEDSLRGLIDSLGEAVRASAGAAAEAVRKRD